MKLKLALETAVGRRILLGNHFTLKSSLHKPKSKEAKRRYEFVLRPNDLERFRFYSVQGSPGCVRITFDEVK